MRWKDYFAFSAAERTGVLTLAGLMMLLIVANMVVVYYPRTPQPPDPETIKMVDEFANSVEVIELEDDEDLVCELQAEQLFDFDPNTADSSIFTELGLSAKQTRTILNYRRKGGKFYKSEDFQKMYCINELEYALLRPYIHISLQDKRAKYKENRDIEWAQRDNKQEIEVVRFEFDPNETTAEDFARLGFNQRQIKSIVNYRQKGGTFRRKDDLLKIYTIDSAFYAEVVEYIRITETKPVAYKKEAITTIELNAATAEDLAEIKGIGTYWAGRIVKYRDYLGGFYAVEQLAEIYGMQPENYERIKPQCTVDKALIKRISINSCKKKQLEAHPYIDDELAKKIVDFRNKHGLIQDISILKTAKVVSSTNFDKIYNYLCF